MKQIYSENKSHIIRLVSQYESMAKLEKGQALDELMFIQLVDFYQKEFNLTKAFEVINKAIKIHKFSPNLHARKAILLLDTHDPDLANESLDRAEMFGLPFIDTQILRAEAFCQLGRFEESKYILRNLKLGFNPTSEELSEIHFIEANIYEAHDEYELMFEALRSTLMEKPNHEKALRRVFMCVELGKKHKESIALHEYLINENPYSDLAWFNLAHAYYYTRNYEDAIDAFEYAYIINPSFESAYRDCVEVCFNMKDYRKALDCMEEAIEHVEIDGDLLLKMGECKENLQQYSEAKVLYFRALSYNPKDDEVYYRIGESYCKEQLWESAIHFYKQAIRLDPHREDYMIALAKNYFNLGRKKRADETFQKVMDMAPDDASCWAEYIFFLIQSNEITKAELFLNEMVDDSTSPDLAYCNAACHFLKNDFDTAFKILKEALLHDFSSRNKIFELVPSLLNNRKIQAMIRYYKDEF